LRGVSPSFLYHKDNAKNSFLQIHIFQNLKKRQFPLYPLLPSNLPFLFAKMALFPLLETYQIKKNLLPLSVLRQRDMVACSCEQKPKQSPSQLFF
ncbi:MAG: hypothetical protein MSH18_00275, partial [Bacteroidales bacterium]|nr:hypothetical protein [Bacteroidales bacterium]